MGLDEILQFRDKAIEHSSLMFMRNWITRIQADNCFFQIPATKPESKKVSMKKEIFKITSKKSREFSLFCDDTDL